jgi:hypothetical protein
MSPAAAAAFDKTDQVTRRLGLRLMRAAVVLLPFAFNGAIFEFEPTHEFLHDE